MPPVFGKEDIMQPFPGLFFHLGIQKNIRLKNRQVIHN